MINQDIHGGAVNEQIHQANQKINRHLPIKTAVAGIPESPNFMRKKTDEISGDKSAGSGNQVMHLQAAGQAKNQNEMDTGRKTAA